MGVKHLWQVLEPTAKLIHLGDLATREGFLENPHGNRKFRIGVDAYALMAQCVAGSQNGNPFGPSGLKIFFYKLCAFLHHPTTMVFVFDGPNRPLEKRKTRVQVGSSVEWVFSCKQLIEAFGYPIHDAPAEAVSDLARLSENDLIDAVLTTDVDALVLGAERVLRMEPNQEKDEYMLYSADTIEFADGVNLSQGGLILFALLCGGDYRGGLRGRGRAIAHALARSYLGNELFENWITFEVPEFDEWVTRDWIPTIENELRTNSSGLLSSRQPRLADILKDDPSAVFGGNLSLIYFYFNASTSWSHRPFTNAPNPYLFSEHRPPNFGRIALLCSTLLGWSNTRELFQVLSNNVCEGILKQTLLSNTGRFNQETSIISDASYHFFDIGAVETPRRTRRVWSFEWSRVDYCADRLVALALSVLPGDIEDRDSAAIPALKAWVPLCYLTHAHENLPNDDQDSESDVEIIAVDFGLEIQGGSNDGYNHTQEGSGDSGSDLEALAIFRNSGSKDDPIVVD